MSIHMLYFTCTCIVVVSMNGDRSTCNYSTCPVCPSVWVLPNCFRFDYSVRCHMYTCTVPYFSHSEISLYMVLRVASVCGQREECGSKARIARQPSLWQSKTPHSKTAKHKTGAVTNRQNKPKRAALRAEGRKTEDWRQTVSIWTSWFRHAARHDFFPPLVLLTYPGEKASLYWRKWLTYARSWLIRGQIEQEHFIEIKSAAGWGTKNHLCLTKEST